MICSSVLQRRLARAVRARLASPWVPDAALAQVGKVRLVNIRNPWGKFEWDGDWGDHSTKWTPELEKAFALTREDDGSFPRPQPSSVRIEHVAYDITCTKALPVQL